MPQTNSGYEPGPDDIVSDVKAPDFNPTDQTISTYHGKLPGEQSIGMPVNSKKDLIKSFQLGVEGSNNQQAYYNAMDSFQKGIITKEQFETAKSQNTSKRSNNFRENSWDSTTAQVAGGMAGNYYDALKSPIMLGSLATGAAAGAAVGSVLGPAGAVGGILPGMATVGKLGFQTAVAYETYSQGAGEILESLDDAGIKSDKLKYNLAKYGGGVYAAIEFGQAGALIPGSGKVFLTTWKQALKYGAKQYAKRVVEEQSEEQLQQLEVDILTAAAQYMEKSAPALSKSLQKMGINQVETFKSSIIPIMLMSAPGSAVETHNAKKVAIENSVRVAEGLPPTAIVGEGYVEPEGMKKIELVGMEKQVRTELEVLGKPITPKNIRFAQSLLGLPIVELPMTPQEKNSSDLIDTVDNAVLKHDPKRTQEILAKEQGIEALESADKDGRSRDDLLDSVEAEISQRAYEDTIRGKQEDQLLMGIYDKNSDIQKTNIPKPSKLELELSQIVANERKTKADKIKETRKILRDMSREELNNMDMRLRMMETEVKDTKPKTTIINGKEYVIKEKKGLTLEQSRRNLKADELRRARKLKWSLLSTDAFHDNIGEDPISDLAVDSMVREDMESTIAPDVNTESKSSDYAKSTLSEDLEDYYKTPEEKAKDRAFRTRFKKKMSNFLKTSNLLTDADIEVFLKEEVTRLKRLKPEGYLEKLKMITNVAFDLRTDYLVKNGVFNEKDVDLTTEAETTIKNKKIELENIKPEHINIDSVEGQKVMQNVMDNFEKANIPAEIPMTEQEMEDSNIELIIKDGKELAKNFYENKDFESGNLILRELESMVKYTEAKRNGSIPPEADEIYNANKMNSIQTLLFNIIKRFDIQNPYTQIGAPLTGKAMVDYPMARQGAIEKGRSLVKGWTKFAHNLIKTKQVQEFSDLDWGNITMIAEDSSRIMSPEETLKYGTIMPEVRKIFDHIGKVAKDSGLFEETYLDIARQESNTREHNISEAIKQTKAVLNDEEAPITWEKRKRAEARLDKLLKDLDTEQQYNNYLYNTNYVHSIMPIIIRNLSKSSDKNKIIAEKLKRLHLDATWASRSGLQGRKHIRIQDSVDYLIANNLVKTQAEGIALFDIRKITADYFEKMGTLMARNAIFKAAMKENILVKYRQGGEGFVGANRKWFKMKEKMSAHWFLSESMDSLIKAEADGGNWVRGIMNFVKMQAFVTKPHLMTLYNTINIGYLVLSGHGGNPLQLPYKLPEYLYIAAEACAKQNDLYWECMNAGLEMSGSSHIRNDNLDSIRTLADTNIGKQLIKHLVANLGRNTEGKNIVAQGGNVAINLMNDVAAVSSFVAWNGEKITRVMAYQLVRSKTINTGKKITSVALNNSVQDQIVDERVSKYSDRESADIVNKYYGHASAIPQATKLFLNYFLFVPTFTISYMKLQVEAFVSLPKTTKYIGQVLLDTFGGVRSGEKFIDSFNRSKYSMLRKLPNGEFDKRIHGALLLLAQLIYSQAQDYFLSLYGWNTEISGLEYSKQVVIDGKTQTASLRTTHPFNVLSRFIGMPLKIGFSNISGQEKLETISKKLWNTSSHNVWKIAKCVTTNADMLGRPIRATFSSAPSQVLDTTLFIARSVMPIIGVFFPVNSRSTQQQKAYRDEVSGLDKLLGIVYSVGLSSSIADKDRRLVKNYMQDVRDAIWQASNDNMSPEQFRKYYMKNIIERGEKIKKQLAEDERSNYGPKSNGIQLGGSRL